MSIKVKLLSFVFLAALLGVAVLQWNLIHQARAEHQRLQAAAHESNTVAPGTMEESEEVRVAKRELARLRNEVHQLRAQKPDLSRLQADNERVHLQLAQMGKPRLPPTEDQRFVLRQNWAHAGFGSPEAAIMTFFWAAREEDYQSALACFTQEGIDSVNLMDKRTQTLRPDAVHGLVRLAQVQGLRIADLRTNSNDSVRVDIQSNPDGPAISFTLRRTGEDWKIDRF